MRVAVGNLLANAVKFTAPRDHATIRIYPVHAEGQTGLAVADNGVGFGMAHADRLFGVFERLHPPDEFTGTGVGLAIVRRIVQKHGGRVWAEAEPGRGATFYLTVGNGSSD
jgi:light-regulated signal transduction histidine kinase (bacteriophytochrome)